MKKFILLIIILGVGINLGIYFQKQSKVQKIETKAQTDAEQAGAVVKHDLQKVDAAATEIKTNIEADIEKSENIATNVAAQVKADAQNAGAVTTSVVGEVKEKLP